MKCVLCGKGEVALDIRDVPFTYKGQKTFIKNIRGEYCSHCGEGYYGPEHDGNKLMSGHREFREKVDAVLAEQATFVEQVRKKLGLDQREAGEIFGGGVNAFSRYETAKVRTPVSVMQLLTLLDRHPELIDEIKERRYRIGSVHEFRKESSAQRDEFAM